MFKENKYTKCYFKIIERARHRLLECAYENHHVTPKSLGGSDEKNNIVSLTLREHYICHLLLTKMCTGESKHKMLYAIHRMCFSGKYGSSSRLYERFRTTFIESLVLNHRSKKDPTSFSDEISKRMFDLWEKDQIRREQTSKRMKYVWANKRELMLSHAIENCLKNARSGKDNHMSKHIKYQGVVYYGWGELLSKTGVTKHLYNKYYVNGIDPFLRKNKNGPLPTK